MEVSMNCQYITNKGTQCKKRKIKRSLKGYCSTHSKRHEKQLKAQVIRSIEKYHNQQDQEPINRTTLDEQTVLQTNSIDDLLNKPKTQVPSPIIINNRNKFARSEELNNPQDPTRLGTNQVLKHDKGVISESLFNIHLALMIGAENISKVTSYKMDGLIYDTVQKKAIYKEVFSKMHDENPDAVEQLMSPIIQYALLTGSSMAQAVAINKKKNPTPSKQTSGQSSSSGL